MTQYNKKPNWWQQALTLSVWYNVALVIFAGPAYACLMVKNSVFLKILGVILALVAVYLFCLFIKSVGNDDEKRMTAEQKTGARAIFVAVTIVMAIIFVMIMGMFGVKPIDAGGCTGSSEELNEYDIWAIAENEVEERLKAPSTAKFCRKSEGSISQSGDTWTVTGYVDAENSFGATMRNDFKVVIKETGGRKYVVESVSID